MLKRILKKIFEKFTQVDNSKKRQYGGAGLGLSISQSLVRAEGGEIQLASQIGQGTKFYFDIQLPYKTDVNESGSNIEASALAAPENSDVSRQSPLPVNIAGKALIIGHGGTGSLLETQISSLGLTAKNEPDVKAALIDLAKAFNTKQPYDVLLIDCDRPDLDGARLIQLIR